MSITEEIFRVRVLTTLEAALKRFALHDASIDSALKKYIKLVKLVENVDNNQDTSRAVYSYYPAHLIISQSLQQSIVTELAAFKMMLRKESLRAEATRLDIEGVERQCRVIEILKVKDDILQLRETLSHEMIKKKYQEEYLALAKLIHKLPTRAESAATIAEAEAALAETDARHQACEQEYSERSRHFQLLLYSIEMLKQEYGNDDPSETSKKRSQDAEDANSESKKRAHEEVVRSDGKPEGTGEPEPKRSRSS